MNIIEVPEVELWDPIRPSQDSVIDFADMLLTCLMKRETALIHAEFRSDNPSVTWFIGQRHEMNQELDEAITVSNLLHEFRGALAWFGHHYMDNQLYGGFSRCLLRQNGISHRCSFYMSNQALSGFWIRIYGVSINHG